MRTGMSHTISAKKPDNGRRDRGSAMVEFCLVFPVLLLMMMGTLDFARAFRAAIIVASAARAGVQFGSLNPANAADSTGMNGAALNDATGQGVTGITANSRNYCACITSNTEVSCSTGTCAGDTPAGYVETRTQYTFQSVIRYPGVPRNMVLTRTAKMRVQ
jgi:Flp pilus assembly protein TadG